MLGNIWLSQAAKYLRRVWAQIQAEIPGLPSIEWYGDPKSVGRVVRQVGSVEPEIVPKGFVDDPTLYDILSDSDLAIIAFNLSDKLEHDYARYSLPSRLTELAACGVPIFCIASPATPLARYICDTQIGVVASAEDERQLTSTLKTLLHSVETRANLSFRARAHAEEGVRFIGVSKEPV